MNFLLVQTLVFSLLFFLFLEVTLLSCNLSYNSYNNLLIILTEALGLTFLIGKMSQRNKKCPVSTKSYESGQRP